MKQLLKETEKYLQKLGSKLQEAKAAAGRFGNDEEAGLARIVDKSETAFEMEDESDQAKARPLPLPSCTWVCYFYFYLPHLLQFFIAALYGKQ